MLKAGVFAKKKRREKQYRLQLTQQQLLQDRLVRDQLLAAAASKEREFVRLSGEVVEGKVLQYKVADTAMHVTESAPQKTNMQACHFVCWK